MDEALQEQFRGKIEKMEDTIVTLEEIEINQVFRDKDKQSTLDEIKRSQQANPGNTASVRERSFDLHEFAEWALVKKGQLRTQQAKISRGCPTSNRIHQGLSCK